MVMRPFDFAARQHISRRLQLRRAGHAQLEVELHGAWIQLVAMLLPSPTRRWRRPGLGPTDALRRSSRPAISWQGCVLSVEPVDHRHGRVLWPSRGASPRRWCAIMMMSTVARQHARGCRRWFSRAPELRVGPAQHDRLAAQLAHCRPRTTRGCVSTASRRSWRASCRRAACRAPRWDRALLHRLAAIEDLGRSVFGST